MEKQCRKEIQELHLFFQDWFNGACPKNEKTFARVEKVLSPDFHLITPNGENITKATLIDFLWQNHNTRETEHLTIDVEKIKTIRKAKDLCIMTYHEIQASQNTKTRRQSIVVFEASKETPNGVQWAYVQETWIEKTES